MLKPMRSLRTTMEAKVVVSETVVESPWLHADCCLSGG